MADHQPYPDDFEGPAERRLAEHLALVRVHPPETEHELSARIVRRAGWQRLARAPLDVVAALIAAVGDAVSIFARSTDRGPEGRR